VAASSRADAWAASPSPAASAISARASKKRSASERVEAGALERLADRRRGFRDLAPRELDERHPGLRCVPVLVRAGERVLRAYLGSALRTYRRVRAFFRDPRVPLSSMYVFRRRRALHAAPAPHLRLREWRHDLERDRAHARKRRPALRASGAGDREGGRAVPVRSERRVRRPAGRGRRR
jgi:hypothetical protein